MQVNTHGFHYIVSNIVPIVWRRKLVVSISVVVASAFAFLFYSVVGERYEAYTLLRVGQGIKERAGNNNLFGEGIDLTSRMDSIAKIGATDHVIRQAAIQAGPDRLFDPKYGSLFNKFRQSISDYISQYNFLKELPQSAEPEPEGLDQAVLAGLRGGISARQEGRSDLLRISYKHRNPLVVADFTNHLANALVAMQAELVQVPGADIFFQQQVKRLEEEAEKASSDLQKFSIEASIYSVSEQRALLLKRASDLSTQIAATRGAIEDRKGQRQSIADQLLVMKPVTQSRTVSSIVNRLGGREDRDKGPVSHNAVGTVPSFDEQPPLLLVRVYQDAMASLLKINSDLNGSLKLEKLLENELHNVNAELAELGSKEAEYDRLKRNLTRASSAADQYGTRMIEEQTSLDVAKKTQLSSVRVVQLAERPKGPMAPQISHLAIIALFGGIAAGAALAVLLEMAKLRHQQQLVNGLDSTLTEFVRTARHRGKDVQAAE